MINRQETKSKNAQARLRVRSLPTYVPGARANDLSQIAKLSSNENPFAPLPGIKEKIVEGLAQINRYPDMSVADLAQVLANFLTTELCERESDVAPIQAENLVFGTGSVAVLAHIVQAFCEAGDEVIYPWRSFEAYPIVVDIAGAEKVQVSLDEQLRADVKAIANAVTQNTKVILLCTPNNPTGGSVRHQDVVWLLENIPAQVALVIDEAYVEFVQGQDKVRSLELLSAYPNVIILRTFSKAYGLAGLRVGYAVANTEIASALRATATPFGVSSIAQIAAIASLGAAPELMERVAELVAERALVLAELRAQGWPVVESQANFVWLGLGDQALAFAEFCKENQVLVRPFAGDGVRISIGGVAENHKFLQLSKQWLGKSKTK